MGIEIKPRELRMICRACGGDQFEHDDSCDELSEAPDDTPMKCAHCGLETTKGELIEDNNESIQAAVDEIADEAAAALMKEIEKAFR